MRRIPLAKIILRKNERHAILNWAARNAHVFEIMERMDFMFLFLSFLAISFQNLPLLLVFTMKLSFRTKEICYVLATNSFFKVLLKHYEPLMK